METQLELAGGAGPFARGARYNGYGAFLRERFGCRVYKVIVDAGFTCPNRDGTVAIGGCTYCNNDSFRPQAVNRLKPIPEQVRTGIAYLKRRYRAQKFVVYFQPFTNTYAPLETLIPLYESSLDHPEVIGLAVGTRPDCVNAEKISWFERLARQYFVTLEYGLESVHDRTLERINRGHDFQCWLDAVHSTRNRGIYLCAHLILGFPWESRDEWLAMADTVSSAGLDFLKLHHLHVVRHTALGRDYLKQPFPLLGYQEYIDLVVDFLERLNPEIRIERLFGLAPEDQLLGPHWGRTKAEIQHDIEQALVRRNTHQGRFYGRIEGGG
ncbi:MAG: TIGR01212 family radical SAM protein [Acidobacteria bacterium]|nr:MAG: TIGR01212 family radical SAM protein [Acidobacteriota bacterium]